MTRLRDRFTNWKNTSADLEEQRYIKEMEAEARRKKEEQPDATADQKTVTGGSAPKPVEP